ncbi:ferric-dicitrate binding protein FerR, regulates iron transport through sigma-19 [Tenacibaculum sp. MAR_2009_124]|uniref:FecR family protein n=1 Tax=Tenacibaculum sp. MAR_2009_124 TaxID=1250059 RepID=UPI00089B7CC8|nr:FecR family protein [Tenacibaculum sp. MAR_2009_124]SEB43909.1 ferric-dicitrate binding protein FerR, regulates iron transport through sigma-19 [Tenacibaculum sp. MAR_2009_124]
MNKRIDEGFLQRWLRNELTEVELKEFQKTSDYAVYEKIMKVSADFETPDFDFDKVYANLNDRIKTKKSKVFKLNWKYIAAASIALLVGLLFFVDTSVKYETSYGEKMAVLLPDSSQVYLNSKASISFNEKNWDSNRKVVLKGEAFFKVKKGKKFKVVTDLGNVSVLGTQFDVQTSKDYVEVKCFEGKVSVVSGNEKNILTGGKASRSFRNGVTENWGISNQEPLWKNGESSFQSIALKYVIYSIENQYGISIKADKINLEQKFTGGYTHSDLKVALKTVFEPMKIDVIFTGENTVTLLKR